MAAGGDLQNVEMKALPPRKRAGWTGGDDRGPSSKPTTITQQTDNENASEKVSEDVSDANSSGGVDQNSKEKIDRSSTDASGGAEAMEEGAGEKAEGIELSEQGMAGESADVEKGGDGRAKGAGQAEVGENGSEVKQSVLDGTGDGVDTGHRSSESAVEVKNGEATMPKRAERDSRDGAKRAVENIGSGSSPSSVDSKRPKTESQGSGVA